MPQRTLAVVEIAGIAAMRVVQDNGQGISATEDWDDVHMLRHEQ